MKAVGYIRVSTEEQSKRLSPEVQEELIRDFAERNNITVVEFFRDLGISGSIPLANRPGFISLLSYAEKHNIKIIVALSLDRLSRNPTDLQYLAYLIQQKGFKIFTVYEHEITLQRLYVDPSTELSAMFHRLYRKFARSKTLENVHKKLIKGHIHSPLSRKQEDITEIANQILKLRREGTPLKRIARIVGLHYKTVRFILWILDQWNISPETCPRCGTRALEPDPDYYGFMRCSNCGFTVPPSKELWDRMLENEEDRRLLELLYEPYIVKLIEMRKQLKETEQQSIQ